MGHYGDYYDEYGIKDEPTWRTHVGRVMKISEMDNQHLQNAINMIHRGYDKSGRKVTYQTKALLPYLEKEAKKREKNLAAIEIALDEEVKMVKKVKEKPMDFVDVRFADNPGKVYTYMVKKGAKLHLGQALVVDNSDKNAVVFVVGINTGRTGYVEITKKVVAI